VNHQQDDSYTSNGNNQMFSWIVRKIGREMERFIERGLNRKKEEFTNPQLRQERRNRRYYWMVLLGILVLCYVVI
jgi:phosphoribosyl-ATP pyrophosphohydrolase